MMRFLWLLLLLSGAAFGSAVPIPYTTTASGQQIPAPNWVSTVNSNFTLFGGGNVSSSGTITAGHCVSWQTSFTIIDAGAACGSGGGGGLIAGTFTSAQVIANYPPASYGGQSVYTTDMGYLLSDGVRWNATNPPIPPGAAVLGYDKNIYTVFPVLSDITYTTTTPIPITRLYSGSYSIFGYISPSSAYATASNGQLQMIYPSGGPQSSAGLLTTINANNYSTPAPNLGYLPFLAPGKGFYVEAAYTLSGNNSDNWFAFFLEPQEHNTLHEDYAPNDPSGFERWIEFDINENGHGTDESGDYRGSVISWLGFYNATCVLTATPVAGATSGTFAASGIQGTYSTWPADTGQYNMYFPGSPNQTVTATFTKGSSAITWTPALTGTITGTSENCQEGRTVVNNVQTASLDYTTEHIFGMSYDPVGKQATFWQDGVQLGSPLSTANASAAINAFHYYPIFVNQSHGSHLAYTANVRYLAAWTTGSPTGTACTPNEQFGTTYTAVAGDNNCFIVLNGIAATTVSLPVSGNGVGGLGGGFSTTVQAAAGAGTVTISPHTPSLINGAASVTVTAGNACIVNSDGSGYQATCSGGGGGGSGTVSAGTTGQIAYYAAGGTTVSGTTTVPTSAGGTGATSLANANIPVQSGTITAGDCVSWASATSITDSGIGCIAGSSYGTFTATLSGFSSGTAGTVNYATAGNLASIYLIGTQITGTSNSTTMTLTGIPAAIQPVNTTYGDCGLAFDNGNLIECACHISGGTLTFTPKITNGVSNRIQWLATGFTSSGTKGLPNGGFQFVYPLQ